VIILEKAKRNGGLKKQAAVSSRVDVTAQLLYAIFFYCAAVLEFFK
jgi:hypothetical protein